MENAEVFIDGYNLYNGICDAGLKPWLWVDLVGLGRQLVPKKMHLQRVNYYTAPAHGESRDHQGAFLEANRELNPDVLNIVNGFMQAEDCCTCHKCRVTFQKWQEKRTDVNMAVDIVMGAAKGDFSHAVLVTGDADQVAAVKAAQSHHVTVAIRMPPARPSGHLTDAVGGTQYAYHLTEKQLKKAQMKAVVIRMGYEITRPEAWGERPGWTEDP